MLNCVVSSMVYSYWRSRKDETYNEIASGCSIIGNNAAYYRIERPGGNICRLIIANATMQQAGVYDCYDGSLASYRSLVTIIDPVASVVVYNQSAEVVVGDQLNISCSINYSGPSSPAPSLLPSPYWTTSPGQNYTSATYHPSPTVVTLVATVTAQKPTVPVFQCNTIFNVTGTENTYYYNATAPPDNFTVGNTAELDVQYGPSTPVITSRPEVITNNGVPCGISVLTCSSTANPAPSYRWYDSADNVLSTTSTLTLGEVNRKYKCEAYNTIRNVSHNASTTYIVSKDNCSTSTVQCCVFPRDETTSVKVEGCDSGTLCDCSQGTSGIIILRCNALTFPNASYMWSGPNVQSTDSPVYGHVTMNGTYRCTAYFTKALSNYTGDVIFPNGTNETNVDKCYNAATTTISTTPIATATTALATTNSDVAIAVAIVIGVLFGISLVVNIILLIIFIRNLQAKHDSFKRTENIPGPQPLDHSDSLTPAAYEELRRSDEIHLQPITYEELTLKPPLYVNQVS